MWPQIVQVKVADVATKNTENVCVFHAQTKKSEGKRIKVDTANRADRDAKSIERGRRKTHKADPKAIEREVDKGRRKQARQGRQKYRLDDDITVNH